MDISRAIAELKKLLGFADNVGLVLVHNRTVRSWSRRDKQQIVALGVIPDRIKVEAVTKREIGPDV